MPLGSAVMGCIINWTLTLIAAALKLPLRHAQIKVASARAQRDSATPRARLGQHEERPNPRGSDQLVRERPIGQVFRVPSAAIVGARTVRRPHPRALAFTRAHFRAAAPAKIDALRGCNYEPLNH